MLRLHVIRFENSLFPKSFKTLVETKDDTYIIIHDKKGFLKEFVYSMVLLVHEV